MEPMAVGCDYQVQVAAQFPFDIDFDGVGAFGAQGRVGDGGKAVGIKQLKGTRVAEAAAEQEFVGPLFGGLVNQGGARRHEVFAIDGEVVAGSQVQAPIGGELLFVLQEKGQGAIAFVDVDEDHGNGLDIDRALVSAQIYGAFRAGGQGAEVREVEAVAEAGADPIGFGERAVVFDHAARGRVERIVEA